MAGIHHRHRCRHAGTTRIARTSRSPGVVRHAQSAACDRPVAASSITCARTCPASTIVVVDHGAGAVSLLAVRGHPQRVFNVHLDTVPDSPGWSADPFELRVDDKRAIGLGACDIKGAAACLLAAAQDTRAMRRSCSRSDEEANDPRCISAFLAKKHGFKEAIIAEPTRCEAVLAHRGIASVLMRFRGRARACVHSECTGCERLAPGRALERARAGFRGSGGASPFWRSRGLAFQHRPHRRRHQGQHDRAIGGIALRIPPAAVAGHRCLARDLPRFRRCRKSHLRTTRKRSVAHRCLPATARHRRRRPPRAGACRRATWPMTLGLPIGNAVDFWTEAALFSAAAGLTRDLVYGPGDIAQAHSAG